MTDDHDVPDEHERAISRRAMWLAYVIGAFGLGMTHQANFLLPLRARELGASFDVIGLIIGAGGLAAALASVALGSLIDWLGPKRSFILGTASCAACAFAFLFITNYWLLIPGHLILGLTRTLAWVASQAYITSIGRPQDRAAQTGRFSFFSNVGAMVGPLAVGIIAQVIGFRLAFIFIATYALAFMVLGLGLIAPDPRDSASRSKQGTGMTTAVQLLRVRGIQVAMLLTFVRLWIEWTWSSFFPVFLVDAGIAAGVAGSLLSLKALVATLMAPTTGYLTRFIPAAPLCTLGLALGSIGLLLSPWTTTFPLFYVPALLVGIGTGWSLPLLLTLVTGAAPTEQRGIALGLRVSINQVAATSAPPVVGPLIAALGLAAAFSMAGTVALGLLSAGALLHRLDARVRSAEP